MKERFKEFYAEKLDFKNLDDQTIVVFDANTLLHIYRYSKEATLSLLKSIQSVKNNVWLPYQVAFEFHRNRQSVKWGVIEKKKYITQSIENELNNSYNHTSVALK